jgi:hypothetical protein
MSHIAKRLGVAAALSLAGTLLLAGCAHEATVAPAKPAGTPKDGKVSYDMMPASDADRYHLTKAEHTFGAQPIDNPPPVYPPELVSANLAATIHAKVIVDGDGKVTDVRDLDTMGGEHHGAFFAAVRDAVMRWRYTPMTVVQEHEDARGNFSQTRSTQPFSLDYSFRFELKDGVPTVSATR